jgi:polysaccharide biosynthesis protein PslG
MHVRARLTRSGVGALAAGALGLILMASGCSAAGEVQHAGHSACPHVKNGPAPRPGKIVFGINSAWNNPCNLRAIRDSGVTMERLEVGWPEVEPQKGRWTWRQFDEQFAVAARHGVSMLPLLMGVPGWAGGDEYSIGTDQAGFARYVARVVSRYGPRGSFWRAHHGIPYRPARWFEIWNEPYLAQFSDGGPNATAYARLFKDAAIAGHRASPGARFLLSADSSGQTQSGSLVPWISTMYQAVPDLNRYFDGVAVHPYSAPQSPLEFTPGHNTRFQFRRIESIRHDFVARGAAAKPFWITEIGWPTCPASPEDCVNETQQAAYLGQMLRTVKTNYSSFVRAVFVYNYRDSPSNADPGNKEVWFGLIRRDGSPKPAWNVLRAEAR